MTRDQGATALTATIRGTRIPLLPIGASALVLALPQAAHAGTGDLLAPLAGQTFPASDASVVANYPGSSLTTATARETTGTIAWDSAAQKWTITAGGESASFGTADIDKTNSNSTLDVYVRTGTTRGDSLTVTRAATSGRFTYRYVSSAFWERQINQGNGATGRFDALVFGLPTAATAIPRSGTATYGVDFLGEGTTIHGAAGITGSGSFDVDFGSGAFALTGSITRLYSYGDDIQLVARGKLGSAGAFSAGLAVSTDPTYFTGGINGRFFGPAANEVGGTWSLSEHVPFGTANAMAGTFMGRSKGALPKVTELGQASHFYAATSGSRVQVSSSGIVATTASVPSFVHFDKATGLYTLTRGSTYAAGATIDDGCARVACEPDGKSHYVSSANWLTRANGTWVGEASLFGLPTPLAGVPRSGGAIYALRMTGQAFRVGESGPDSLLGTGRMIADFGSGSISIAGHGGRTNSIRNDAVASGDFTGTGAIAADTHALSGSLVFKLETGTLKGAWQGAFYGPQASDVGLTFALKGPGIAMAGALLGQRDPALAAATMPLARFTARTTFRGPQEIFTVGRFGVSEQDIPAEVGTWTPATNSWTIPTSVFSAWAVALDFNATTRRPDLGDALTTAYRTTAGGRTWTLRVYRQGSSEIALTYASFYRLSAPGTTGYDPTITYAAFGNATPEDVMPRSGTGKYALAFRGEGYRYDTAHQQRTDYTLSGKGLLTANFLTNQVIAAGTLTGTRSTGATSSFGTFSTAGTFYGASWTAHNAEGVDMNGNFYGPLANEVAGLFSIDRLNLDGTVHTRGFGVVLGTRSN